MTKKIQWFARGGNLARQGPYKTQLAAWKSLTLTEKSIYRVKGWDYPENSHVWPEEINEKDIL